MAAQSSDDRWRERLPVHGDPVKQIGVTPDGSPVHMDARQLIDSPDEQAERWANTLDNRRAGLIDRMAKDVLKNAATFIEETFMRIASKTGRELYQKGDGKAAFDYAVTNGIEGIQDGLVTVVKCKGKVLRTMTASVGPIYRDAVIRRVNVLVKRLPANV